MLSAPSYPNVARVVSATEVKKSLFAAAIGLLVCACGAVPGAGGAPTPTGVLGVTEKEHVATVHVGQKLELALHASNGMNNWSHPESSDTSVLAPSVDPAATAAIGVTLAMFIAKRPGTVDVTATASPRCPPNAACPMYLQEYSLKVTVAS
jgi:hypothetical protein